MRTKGSSSCIGVDAYEFIKIIQASFKEDSGVVVPVGRQFINTLKDMGLAIQEADKKVITHTKLKALAEPVDCEDL